MYKKYYYDNITVVITAFLEYASNHVKYLRKIDIQLTLIELNLT